MHINDNQRTECDLLKLLKALSDQGDSIEELFANLVIECFDAFGSLIITCFFEVVSPVDLATVEDTLTCMLQDPVWTVGDLVVDNRVIEYHTNRHVHHLLDFAHPVLDLFVAGVDRIHELNLLLLTRHHGYDGCIRHELHIVHVLEHLLEMRSHVLDFLSLRKDFKQILGGQEVESGEDSALLLKIVLETTLHLLEVGVAHSEGLQETRAILKFTRAGNQHVRVVLSALDDLDPLLVDSLELL